MSKKSPDNFFPYWGNPLYDRKKTETCIDKKTNFNYVRNINHEKQFSDYIEKSKQAIKKIVDEESNYELDKIPKDSKLKIIDANKAKDSFFIKYLSEIF